MAGLVECVPNFSEGRRTKVVDALAQAVEDVPEVFLLDRTSDPDHNRSVLTFAGPAQAVTTAMEAAVDVALQRIDMRKQSGQHPRIGAVDVIPFVPLGDTTVDECVELARGFGARIAARFDLPVYLYAKAAGRRERAVLADIRKPQFEGLGPLMAERDWQPDFGPSRLHPTAGATAIGARPFLIAYNINLDSPDVDLAKRIAHRIRERGGGLPRVQALGLFLEELGCAQVSLNLLDFSVTPIWQVWEAVGELASSQGVERRESELIGLVPERALLDVADHIGSPPDADPATRLTEAASWLRIRDFHVDRVLEMRLAMAQTAGGTGG